MRIENGPFQAEARENHGRLTPEELALDTGQSFDECKVILMRLVDKGIADPWVTGNGLIVYAFPAFLPERGKEIARSTLELLDADFDDDEEEEAEVVATAEVAARS